MTTETLIGVVVFVAFILAYGIELVAGRLRHGLVPA